MSMKNVPRAIAWGLGAVALTIVGMLVMLVALAGVVFLMLWVFATWGFPGAVIAFFVVLFGVIFIAAFGAAASENFGADGERSGTLKNRSRRGRSGFVRRQTTYRMRKGRR